jgi:hypothetical protein
MSWFAWAVLSSLCAAILAESNRHYRLDPQILNAWRSTVAAALLLVAFPFMDWPVFSENKGFYIVAAIDGIVTAIGMVVFFWLAARKTGRVTSMVLPLAAIGAYATWWLLMPSERPVLVETPGRVYLAVLSILMILLAMQKVRANDAGWESFVTVMPIGLVFGIVDALTKWVMGDDFDAYGLGVSYSFLSMLLCAGVAWIAAMPKPAGGRKMGFFEGKVLWGSFWCGFWTAGFFLSGVFALYLAPNPTYPGIILALTPLWLYALNYVRGQDDDASPVPSLLIVIGAAMLLVSTL